jgi:hypothetical protein
VAARDACRRAKPGGSLAPRFRNPIVDKRRGWIALDNGAAPLYQHGCPSAHQIVERAMAEHPESWLIARLFDFSFTRFVSLPLVRIVYAILAVAGLTPLLFGCFVLFQMGQDYPEALLLAWLLTGLTPIIFLLYLFLVRLLCETLIVLFAIAEHMKEVSEALKRQAAAPPAP